ncbi:putative DUF895 domain membrane protein [Seiridium cardinale]|uniref:DUF895 domain membrane protein n=1 Tax=Seiridium cardinale TaxID=138064 RepID=A0ABR2XRP0_9PEZI
MDIEIAASPPSGTTNNPMEHWLREGDVTHVKHSVPLPTPYKIQSLEIRTYSHPRVQACMLDSVLFMTVGAYNVITFIGGAEQQTAWLSDIANIALYTVFTMPCLIEPASLNFFGLRTALCFGGFGYAAYGASLRCYNRTGNVPFVVFGGCWCGVPAAFMWTAEGNGTYVGLSIPTVLGAFLGLAMYPWHKTIREDGSLVMIKHQKTFKQELVSSVDVCRRNPWVMFFCSMCKLQRVQPTQAVDAAQRSSLRPAAAGLTTNSTQTRETGKHRRSTQTPSSIFVATNRDTEDEHRICPPTIPTPKGPNSALIPLCIIPSHHITPS